MVELNQNEMKALRARKRYTQRDAAKLLGMGLSTYRLKETGNLDFSMSELQKLSEVFDIKIIALKDGIFFTQ